LSEVISYLLAINTDRMALYGYFVALLLLLFFFFFFFVLISVCCFLTAYT